MNVLSQHAQAPHFSFMEELDNFDEDPEGPYDEQFESLEEESRRNDVPNELIELRQRLQSLKRGQPPPTTVEGLSEGIQPDVLRELHHDGLESQVNLLKFHILVASPKKDLVGSCSVAGVSKSGNKQELALRLLRKDIVTWKEDFSGLRNIPYQGPEKGSPSLKLRLSIGRSPLPMDIFNEYLPDWLIKKVARWTNVKADLLKHSRPSWVANTRRWPPSYLRSWKRVTLEELRRWIAVLLARSMASGVSSREFWKENSFFDYSQGSHIMGRDRWLSISNCLCIYDPLKDPSFPPPPGYVFQEDGVIPEDPFAASPPPYAPQTENQPYFKATDFCDMFSTESAFGHPSLWSLVRSSTTIQSAPKVRTLQTPEEASQDQNCVLFLRTPLVLRLLCTIPLPINRNLTKS